MATDTLPTMTIDTTTFDARYDGDLHVRLFARAMPVMTGYQSDLAIDLASLGDIGDVGTFWLWMVRESGTHLHYLGQGITRNAAFEEALRELRRWQTDLGQDIRAASVIEVTKARAPVRISFPQVRMYDMQW